MLLGWYVSGPVDDIQILFHPCDLPLQLFLPSLPFTPSSLIGIPRVLQTQSLFFSVPLSLHTPVPFHSKMQLKCHLFQEAALLSQQEVAPLLLNP